MRRLQQCVDKLLHEFGNRLSIGLLTGCRTHHEAIEGCRDHHHRSCQLRAIHSRRKAAPFRRVDELLQDDGVGLGEDAMDSRVARSFGCKFETQLHVLRLKHLGQGCIDQARESLCDRPAQGSSSTSRASCAMSCSSRLAMASTMESLLAK